MLSHIVAIDQNGGIGIKGGLPWHLPADLKRFKEITMGHTILMGRKTWESIGRALPGRKSVVVSRQKSLNLPQEVLLINDLSGYLKTHKDDKSSQIFVIGGSDLYQASLPWVDRLYLTRISAKFKVDTFYEIPSKDEFIKTAECEFTALSSNELSYALETWERKSK